MPKMKDITDIKNNEIDAKNSIKGFISMAKMGLASKEEIGEKIQFAEEKIEEIDLKIKDLRQKDNYNYMDSNAIIELINKDIEYDATLRLYNSLIKECNIWLGFLADLQVLMNEYKNFNKKLCFSNIRELLRQNSDVKIGQIEKEAGIRLGYMSRLEKEGNTSEPSMEFIVSAAKLLKVSIDTLVTIDLTSLTPTENYLVNFIDKLKEDTIKDKLDWNRETANKLNSIEANVYGYVTHPLFTKETFYDETNSEYSEEVTRVVFNSKTFGPHTYIHGDCFNLYLKNGAILYLMDVAKSIQNPGEHNMFAKEVCMYLPNKGKQVLVSSQDNTPVAPLLDILFSTVKERMEHPKISNDVMQIIDSFMNDEVLDDPLDLPF